MKLQIDIDADELETLRSAIKGYATSWAGIARLKPKKEKPFFEAKVEKIRGILAKIDGAVR